MQFFSTPLPVLAVAAAIYYAFWSGRNKAFQTLIDCYHLARLEADLPGDFPLNATLQDKDGLSTIRHAISGHYGDDFLLAFDLRIGSGRQVYTRTIVARRFAILPPSCILPNGVQVIESGSWRIVYTRRNLLTPSARLHPKAIEQLWNLLAGPDATPLHPRTPANPIASDTLLIRPRKH